MNTEQQLKMLESIPASSLKEVTAQTDLFGEVSNVTEYTTSEAIPEELISSNTIDGTTTRPQEPGATPNYGNVDNGANFKPVDFVSPALAVNIIDTVFPMVAVIAVGFAGYEVSPKSLKMTASERKLMEEPTQELLATMNVKMSPLEKFFVCLTSIYSAKALEIVSNGEYKKKTSKKKTENMLDKDFEEQAVETPKKPRGRRRL